MKGVIFGASGGIGKFTVRHALEKGYEVKSFLRNPSKLTIKHKNLTTVQGEINNYNDIKNAIFDCDAVIWCVGIPMKKYVHMDSLEGHQYLLKAFGDKKMNFNISKEDIGTFMVEQLSSDTYELSMPIIGS